MLITCVCVPSYFSSRYLFSLQLFTHWRYLNFLSLNGNRSESHEKSILFSWWDTASNVWRHDATCKQYIECIENEWDQSDCSERMTRCQKIKTNICQLRRNNNKYICIYMVKFRPGHEYLTSKSRFQTSAFKLKRILTHQMISVIVSTILFFIFLLTVLSAYMLPYARKMYGPKI